MTGDLAGPDQRAAQQAYEAAARLYEQAAPELDRAAAHCRVAAPISEGPRCRGERRTPGRCWVISASRTAVGGAGSYPPPQGRPSRACVEDHLRPVTGGTYDSRCRRLGSPQSSEVPAETSRSPPAPAGGRTQRKDRCSGVRRPWGWSPGTGVRSGRWRCRSGARSPTACDPSASLPRPAPSRPERAWPFAYPGRSSAGRPRTSRRRAPSHRQRQARCAHPFRTLDGGGGGALRDRRGSGRAAGWLASRVVLGRYVLRSSGVVKPARMSQV
jgi:hypothetical protein